MKRGIAIGAALTLTILALVGPLTAQAGPPWLYGCTPAAGGGGAQTYALNMYNSVGTTANVTAKVLSRTNAHLSTLINPATFTIVGGRTKTVFYVGPTNSANGFTWEAVNDATAPATIRITSDQPLSVGLNRNNGASDDWVPCLPIT